MSKFIVRFSIWVSWLVSWFRLYPSLKHFSKSFDFISRPIISSVTKLSLVTHVTKAFKIDAWTENKVALKVIACALDDPRGHWFSRSDLLKEIVFVSFEIDCSLFKNEPRDHIIHKPKINLCIHPNLITKQFNFGSGICPGLTVKGRRWHHVNIRDTKVLITQDFGLIGCKCVDMNMFNIEF